MKYITIKDSQHFVYSHKLGLEIPVSKSTARMYSLYEIDNHVDGYELQGTEWDIYEHFTLKALKNGSHFNDEQIKEFVLFMKEHQRWGWYCMNDGVEENIVNHRGITFGYAKFKSSIKPYTTLPRTSEVLGIQSSGWRPSSCWQVDAIINWSTLSTVHERYLKSVNFTPMEIGVIKLHYGYHDNRREYDNDITKLFDKIIKDNDLIQKRDKAIYSIKSREGWSM